MFICLWQIRKPFSQQARWLFQTSTGVTNNISDGSVPLSVPARLSENKQSSETHTPI